jgi:malate dehydrogenase
LTKRIQFGGDEGITVNLIIVVKAKDGTGSATLSMAHAGAVFANSVLKAMNGTTGITLPAFVESPVGKKMGLEFFSTNVELGKDGVKAVKEIGKINAFEENLIKEAIPELKKNIEKGIEFASK